MMYPHIPDYLVKCMAQIDIKELIKDNLMSCMLKQFLPS